MWVLSFLVAPPRMPSSPLDFLKGMRWQPRQQQQQTSALSTPFRLLSHSVHLLPSAPAAAAAADEGTIDILTAAAWPNVDEGSVLLQPHEVRATWREFMATSNVLVQQVSGAPPCFLSAWFGLGASTAHALRGALSSWALFPVCSWEVLKGWFIPQCI